MSATGFSLTYSSPTTAVVAFVRRPVDGFWWDAATAKWAAPQGVPIKLAPVPKSTNEGYGFVYSTWFATDPAAWADGRYEVWFHVVDATGKVGVLLPPCCGSGHVAGPADLWLRGGNQVMPGSVGPVILQVAAWPVVQS